MGDHTDKDETGENVEIVFVKGRPQVSRTPQQARDNTRLVWSAIMMLVAFGAATVFNIWYTSYSQRQSDQKFCALFVGLDDRYRVSIPSGSEEFAQQIHELRLGLHCPDTVIIPTPPAPSQE